MVGAGETGTRREHSVPPQFAADGEGIDLNIFDGVRELMGEAMEDVLESFLDEGRKRLETMRAQLIAEDGDQLQRVAHALKGAAANLGLTALSDACAELDQNARLRGCEGSEPLLSVVETAFAHAEMSLPRLMKR